jgi:enoyl-CoA hydratase
MCSGTWKDQRNVAIDLERRDHIAIITVNRPDKLNALESDGLRDLRARVDEAAGDVDVRVIVLTGAGDRAFVAGADIREIADYDLHEGRTFGELGHAATRALELAPQPVIAAVNGFALGGGCELALACDIRIASTNAVFAQPEVSLGIPPGWGGTQRLPRIVAPGLAAELIFTGRRVDAAEALRIGLVNAVHGPPDLMPKTLELANQIAANSPWAVQAAKNLMAYSRGGGQFGLEAELDVFGDTFGSRDQREGMHAFLERRTPEFGQGSDA